MKTKPKLYNDLLSHDLWIVRRDHILSRDGRRCGQCSSTENLLVHHRQYHVDRVTGDQLKPWDYDDLYLITLCSRCHELGHRKFKVPTFKK